MSKSARAKKRRNRLWEEDPRCYWCGIITVPPNPNGGFNPLNAATIDHLRSRYNPDRWLPRKSPDEVRTVLACRECNERRSAEETKEQPIEELWLRSRRKEYAL